MRRRKGRMIELVATLGLAAVAAACDDDPCACAGEPPPDGGEGDAAKAASAGPDGDAVGSDGNAVGSDGNAVGSDGNAVGSDGNAVEAGVPSRGTASFFVTSETHPTGDLGGLVGADVLCQALADGAGYSARRFAAYLSAERDPDNVDMPVHARDRIGTGPWYNALGALVAADLASLHARTGDASVFLDENGERINGQWEGSPSPNEHDILTGSDLDGRLLPGKTCEDWTSDSPDLSAQVGHSDGLGPGRNQAPPLSAWQSAHANQSCADTAPRGGAGHIYCFAFD